MEAGEYCRELEAYLCRKNDGHLIRIVGPAFETVSGWATQGIPFNVACRGIDRYFERYYAKGPRRRPVRIEFCEADVLDAFDEWRRAVGVGLGEGPGSEPSRASREGLPTHLDRVIARLTVRRAGEAAALEPVLEPVVRELDAMRAGARGLRGDARARALLRLEAIERELAGAVRASSSPALLVEVSREAQQEMAPFLSRMAAGERERAIAACEDRLLRERAGLPRIRFE
jgi:hypothetical protein